MDDEDTRILIRPKTAMTGTRSRSMTRRSKNNPFVIPPVAELLADREEEEIKIKEERDLIRSMTLKQRADMLRPPIPEYLIRSSQHATPNISFSGNNTAPIMPKSSSKNISHKLKRPKTRGSFFITNRQLINGDFQFDDGFDDEKYKKGDPNNPTSHRIEGCRISEFIQQKREIYHVQMLMDRKNYEIQRLNKQIAIEEANLLEQEQNIEESSQSYKIQNAKVEADLARARKRMEEASRKKVAATKNLRLFKQQVEIMKAEISKNLDLLDEYQSYKIFLESITPQGRDTEQYFTDPANLMIELEVVEKDNLFLIQQCQVLQDMQTRGKKTIKEEIESTDIMIEKAQNNLYTVEEVPPFDSSQINIEDRQDEVESQLKHFAKLVNNLHIRCYKKESNISTMGILEKIENDLEDMYKTIDMIDSKFVSEKQSNIDKRRREQQRKDKLEKQALEQKMKTDQALKRATQPIKKQTGRPLYERTSPVKIRKTNDAKLLAQKIEQQRVDTLLYGELYP